MDVSMVARRAPLPPRPFVASSIVHLPAAGSPSPLCMPRRDRTRRRSVVRMPPNLPAEPGDGKAIRCERGAQLGLPAEDVLAIYPEHDARGDGQRAGSREEQVRQDGLVALVLDVAELVAAR